MNIVKKYASMFKVKVEYNGKYPNLCSGDLLIYIGDNLVYKTKNHSFFSTGEAYVDNNGDEHITCGELLWDEDAYGDYQAFLLTLNYPLKDKVKRAVSKEIHSVCPCCGGCI